MQHDREVTPAAVDDRRPDTERAVRKLARGAHVTEAEGKAVAAYVRDLEGGIDRLVALLTEAQGHA